MSLRHFLVVAAALLVGNCNDASATDDYDEAIERAEYQLEDASYEDFGDTSQCTEDCSGHESGFEWARDNGLTDPSECGGNSPSFIEGCETYTTALEDDAADGGEDDEADGL